MGSDDRDMVGFVLNHRGEPVMDWFGQEDALQRIVMNNECQH